jgi:hypothetical protein
MSDDLVAFLKAHTNRDLQTARTVGALRCVNDSLARLATIEKHQDNPVILRALADRYGGYHVGWERGDQPTA